MKIDTALLTEDINSYSDSGDARKAAFHRAGKRFLKELAAELGLAAGSFDVRSNQGGIAVSGEVTLHANKIYVQLSESCIGNDGGVSILYRSCQGRKDCCGGRNNHISMRELARSGQERFIETCKGIVNQNTIENKTGARRPGMR